MHHCAGLVTRFAEYLKPRLLKISELQANRMPTLWSLIIRVSVCQNPMNIHCHHCKKIHSGFEEHAYENPSLLSVKSDDK